MPLLPDATCRSYSYARCAIHRGRGPGLAQTQVGWSGVASPRFDDTIALYTADADPLTVVRGLASCSCSLVSSCWVLHRRSWPSGCGIAVALPSDDGDGGAAGMLACSHGSQGRLEGGVLAQAARMPAVPAACLAPSPTHPAASLPPSPQAPIKCKWAALGTQPPEAQPAPPFRLTPLGCLPCRHRPRHRSSTSGPLFRPATSRAAAPAPPSA